MDRTSMSAKLYGIAKPNSNHFETMFQKIKLSQLNKSISDNKTCGGDKHKRKANQDSSRNRAQSATSQREKLAEQKHIIRNQSMKRITNPSFLSNTQQSNKELSVRSTNQTIPRAAAKVSSKVKKTPISQQSLASKSKDYTKLKPQRLHTKQLTFINQ